MTEGENFIGVFPAVSQESQFQELLDAARKRGEQHRKNYQRLKMDHHRLEEEYKRVNNDIQQLSTEYRRAQDASQEALSNAQTAIQEKDEELTKLREQLESVAFNEEARKLELPSVRAVPNNEKQLEALESECESLRQETSYLRHQHSMLLAQTQFNLLKAKRKADEMKTRHAIELQAVQEVNSVLSADPLQINSSEEELQALRRENLQLHFRVKSSETERNNLRLSNEKTIAKSEEATRDHLRTVALHANSLRDLESEKNHLKLQKEVVLVELASCRKDCSAAEAQCRNLRNELSHAKNVLSSLEHDHTVEIERLRASFVEELEQVKTEKEAVLVELNSVQLDLRLSQETTAKQKALLKEGELKWERELEAAVQEQLCKEKKAHDSRLILENKLKEIEKQSEMIENNCKNIVSASEENLNTERQERIRTAKEADCLRAKVKELTEELKLEQKLHLELKKLHEEFELQTKKSQASLAGQIQRLQEHAYESQLQLQKLQAEHSSELKNLGNRLQEQVHLSAEREELQKKIGELKFQAEGIQLTHKQEINDYKKKIKALVQENSKDQKTIKELKSSNRLIKKNNVSEEEHKQVLQNLQELQKRHHLFRSILSSTSDQKQLSMLQLEESHKTVPSK